MRRRQPLPALWLMTDERLGEGLWDALARLPRGGGVVFRDYATPAAERRARFERVRAVARRRGLVLVVAGDPPGRADGRHNRRTGRIGTFWGIVTFAAHNRAEAVAAMRAGADAVFVSPVFATASHPGAPTLGPMRFGLLAKRLPLPVIALGGMDARRFRRLKPLGAHGWAAIDALSPQRQKRKAVPT